MKSLPIALIALACTLPSQAPGKKPDGRAIAKPTNAASAQPASVPANLDELQRQFRQQKFAALDAYVKLHGDAKDAPEAIVEAVDLAQELGDDDGVLRLADLYLKANATGDAASQMQLARGSALRSKGDVAGAQKVFEEVQNTAHDDLNAFVEATSSLADLLAAEGKKDAAIKVLNDAGDSRSDVRGLKQHFDSLAKNYELIGTEPQAIGHNDIHDKAIDLAEYKGKVLLLDFWATWCGPCMGELPNVVAAYRKYHDKGFEILGISLDQDREAFEKCIAAKDMSWRHYFDGKGWENEVAVAYGIHSIPATYLVGKDGKIVTVGLRGGRLEKELARLLK